MTLKVNIKIFEEHAMTPSRGGHPLKISAQVKKTLVREATRGPRVTLKELRRPTAKTAEALHWKTTKMGYVEESTEFAESHESHSANM